jgi:hydrogenase nickel incorporation protein HypA/HybF
MHEFTIVQQMVERLLARLREDGIEDVRRVRVRRDSTFSAEALRQSWELVIEGTPLERAELVVEDVVVEHACSACGRRQTITSADLVHHLFFCPACGQADEIEEARGLQVLDVSVGTNG